jgi:uncharacterized protein YndB with AHSA1/START domain
MSSTQTVVVEREVRVSASPETIFPFLIDPEKIVRWKGTEAMLDPRPGGIYRVNVAGKHMARGEYVEVNPNSKVVFTLGWEGNDDVPPGSSTVEVSLIPDGDETIVRLRHTDLPTPESAAEHTMGWDHYMARLATASPGGDPGEDPMIHAEM